MSKEKYGDVTFLPSRLTQFTYQESPLETLWVIDTGADQNFVQLHQTSTAEGFGMAHNLPIFAELHDFADKLGEGSIEIPGLIKKSDKQLLADGLQNALAIEGGNISPNQLTATVPLMLHSEESSAAPYRDAMRTNTAIVQAMLSHLRELNPDPSNAWLVDSGDQGNSINLADFLMNANEFDFEMLDRGLELNRGRAIHLLNEDGEPTLTYATLINGQKIFIHLMGYDCDSDKDIRQLFEDGTLTAVLSFQLRKMDVVSMLSRSDHSL